MSDFTATTADDITIGTTTYTVEVVRYGNTERYGDKMVTLTGPRGASYFLRPFRGEDDGLRQVISNRTGQPLRVRGNEVRVIAIGDVIEVA